MRKTETISYELATEAEILSLLDCDLLPRHMAIIMDGNGRWAANRGLPRIAGHREGLNALREVLDTCHDLGVQVVTIYAFSNENWNRPPYEIKLLMDLLENYLLRERHIFLEKETRFLPIGRLDRLPPSLQTIIQEVTEETHHFTNRVLVVALSYGGRSEIVDATRKLVRDIQTGTITVDQINEDLFSQYLSTQGLPDPDLLIRTSGETRISNFLPWQIAYTELYFTKTLWPDFRRRETLLALLDFQNRDRRFGSVPQSMTAQNG